MTHDALRYLGLGMGALLLAGAVYACGADSEDTTSSPRGKGGAGGNKPDGSTTNGGAPGQGGAAGGILMDAALGEGSMNADTACAAAHVEATGLPLDLYLMVDRSGSMDNSTNPTKWESQEAALTSFVNDPKSTGLFIAMNFFPMNDDYTMSPSCNGTLYAMPKVQWGELPGAAPAIVSAIANQEPNGYFTPTADALNGVLKGARDRQLQQPLHVVAAVIVSDGEPCCYDPDWGTEKGCTIEDANGIGAIAAQFAAGTPPVKTFAIYVDKLATDVMTAIASKGGTGAPFDATGGAQDFIAALEKIKGQALGCEYKLPEADGGKVNPALVDVEYTPGTGSPTKYPKVANQNACGSDVGWYYDDPANPQKLILCPVACEVVKKDDKGKLDILLGCTPDTR